MEQLINKITEEAFSKYGNSTLFREYNFTPIVVNKLAAVYRVQSAINYPYIYEIQIHVFDKVQHAPSLFDRFHKCAYCKKGKADYKFNCCERYTHMECAIQNKFACCYNKDYLVPNFPGECCVCLEETDTMTHCCHHLCYECLGKMNTKGKPILCPMCRTTIIDEKITTDFISVRVNNKEEVVCVSYL
jgi:hypothetical protein